MTYQDNMATERHGLETITNFLAKRTGRQPIPITDRNQQKLIGDLVVVSAKGTTSIEVKIEEKYTGRCFVETFSNREFGAVGWLFTCQAQQIVFYWRDADVLVGMSMQALRHWLLNQQNGTLDNYKQIRVKQSGKNDTWGACPSLDDLRAAQLDGWWEAHPRQELENART